MSIAYHKNRSLTIIARLGLVMALLVTALSALLPGRPMSAAGAYQPNADTVPPGSPLLRLHRGTLDIRTAQQLAPTSSLAAPAPGPYAIIQLYGPVTLADRQALERTGIELLEYLPDYAYLVQGTATQREAAARLPQVYAHTPFTLADKLAPALLRAIARGDTGTWQVRIIGWWGEESRLARELKALGLGQEIAADASMLLRVAGLESVRWVEPVGRPRMLNDYARSIMNVEPAWQHHRLFGANQIIAVTDSGLDTGDVNTISPDFAGRILATHVLSTGGHWDDNHGHGTHVLGSAAGAGVQSGADPTQHEYVNSFAGVAPEANLVVQAFEARPDGTVIGLPADLYPLFAQVYTDGARLHTNSWGDYTGPVSDTEAAYGGYPYDSQRTDEFVWDHPDMAIFFAAGNSGVDGTPVPPLGFCTGSDGIVDPDSLLAPGTAKNVITVGATESNRNTGGWSAFPWVLVNLCFGAAPINLDYIADNPDGMAAFSSRGPVDDGRAKPDIVAPGTNIVSSRSHAPGASALWGAHETYPDDYAYSGGTSMATPLVAGMGVLVREWLLSQGYANPSAAAIKAVLLDTAKDIAPGQYGESDAQEIPFERPNHVAGWGRADLGFVDAPAPYALWLDDHTAGLTTGQTITYAHTFTHPLRVLTNTQPLRVMLAWTDPPASLSASAQLVNDLDLVVTGPGGATYYGNDVLFGDRTNNVEGVIVDDPPTGTYHVQVSGYNVPLNSQPYALVVAGPLRETQAPALTVIKTADVSAAEVGQTITYTYRVTNSGAIPLTGIAGKDDRLGQVAFGLDTLVPNQGVTSTLTYTVRLSDWPGPLTNVVAVSGTTAVGPSVVVSATAAESVSLLASPDFVLSKRADPDMVEAGAQLTYTIYVTNTGFADLHATITDTLPFSVTLGKASGSTLLPPGGPMEIVWTAEITAPGSVWTEQVVVTVDEDYVGPLANVVRVTTKESATGVCTETARVIAEWRFVYLPLVLRD